MKDFFGESNGTSLNFGPGQHNGSLMMVFNPVYVGVCLIIPPVFSTKAMLRAIDTNCMAEWCSPAETLTPVRPKKVTYRPSHQGRVKYWASLGGSWILPRSGQETEEGFFIKVLQTTTKHSPPFHGPSLKGGLYSKRTGD